MNPLIVDPSAAPVPTSICVQTRLGTPIPNAQPREISLMDERVSKELRARHQSAMFRTPLIPVYNCHGLTFASRRTAINEVDAVWTILSEDCYDEIPPEDVVAGDVILYVSLDGDIEHSGVVSHVLTGSGSIRTPWVYSKWGKGPEVLHAWADCAYTQNAKYYRIRR